MKDIRVAAVIFNSPVDNPGYNLDRMTRWIKEAKRKDAAIVCFPEMNVTGYDIQGGLLDVAESVPGQTTGSLSGLAASNDIIILAGIAEKDASGHIYASHLVINPNGDIGVYRKLHIAPPERSILSAGSTVPIFEAPGVKFGIQLCYDAHFPELATHMAEKGAEIIFIPHASPRGTPEEKYKSWMRHLPARAYDNSLFVLACNQTGENGKGLFFPGLAVIIGPSGRIIEQELSGDEGVVIADLLEEDLTLVRNNSMHFFLPNRRPELLRT